MVFVLHTLVYRVVFCRSLFDLIFSAIVLSVLPRFTASKYPFGTFKHFLHCLIYDHNYYTVTCIYKPHKSHVVGQANDKVVEQIFGSEHLTSGLFKQGFGVVTGAVI